MRTLLLLALFLCLVPAAAADLIAGGNGNKVVPAPKPRMHASMGMSPRAFGLEWARWVDLRASKQKGNPFRVAEIGCGTGYLVGDHIRIPVFVCDVTIVNLAARSRSCWRSAITVEGEVAKSKPKRCGPPVS